ncbi:MAG: DUF2812 domain-containing protein [Acidobacteria bacterium]|jgi:hypothetical protein|nr:DUF2812 domain-containing protein [Acidobacteriota bacterium]
MNMEKERMRKFKWFWAWDDEKEEKWLEAMSGNGWHLENPGLPCVYHFIKGEPRAYSYRLDFRTGSFKSLQEYLQICRDAGWEMIGRMSSWYYFRKECRGGEKPEFFSDKDSKVQKYRRLLIFLVIFLPIMFNGMLNLSRVKDSGFLSGLRIFYAFILLFFSYAILRLLLRIKKLKKS